MTHTNGLKDVNTLINRFGGMRPMARKLNIAVSTIQGWKKRDHIPSDRVAEVVRGAKDHHISLEGFDIGSTANENINLEQTEGQNKNHSTPNLTDIGVKNSRGPSISPPRAQPQYDTKSIKADIVKRSLLTTFSILVIFGGLGYVLFGKEAKQLVEIASNQEQIDNRFSSINEKYTSFENTVTQGLNSLNEQVTDIAAAVGVERNSNGQIILNNNLSLSERLTGLESRLRNADGEIDLGQLMSRFDNLTQSLTGQGDASQALNDFGIVIDGLQSRMSEFEAALEQAKIDNKDLEQALGNVTGRDVSAAAMLLALTQMRSSLNRAQPFSDDLAVLQELVGNDDPELTNAISRLAPYAESGVLSPAGLSNELRGITGEIIAAAIRGEDVSITDKIMGRIGQILSIEKDGNPVVGIKEQSIISNAQSALERGDVQTALAELNKLEGEAAARVSPLTLQAQGTLEADNTVTLMMQNLLQKLKQPNGLNDFIKNLPNTVQNKGQIYGDQESGLIILE